MTPKAKKDTKKTTPTKAAAADEEETEPLRKQEKQSPSESSHKRKVQQNMVNQLKLAKKRIEDGTEHEGDEERVQLYDRYVSLHRLDKEKETLLEMWEKDKSLFWWRTYEESRRQSFKTTDDGLQGWGSRRTS